MDIHLLDSQGATVGDWQVWQALVGSLRTFRGQPEDLQWEEVLRSNALTRALTPTDARRIWTHVVRSFGFDDRPFHVQLRELSRIFSEDDAVEGDYRLFREQKDVFPFPLGSPSGSPSKSPSPVAVGRKLELFEPLFDPMKPFTAPVMPMKASVADSAMPGHLINFVRFLRLRAAEEAWQQRHASEHVSALLGRSLEAQELPLWAKEGGALHMAAKTRRDKDDMKEEKGKENKENEENEGKEGKEASEGAAFEVFRRYLFSSSPQLADPGEVPELERLESLWPLYLRFQRQQSECEVMWLSESSELTSHAWQRESFMLRMMKVLPELAASHWHCFLARLLMSLHNDVLLFVGIQLPFLAFEASRPSTQGRFSAQICDDADVPHPYGLWAATERFLCLAGVDSHTAELKTRDLRHRSVALLDAAPELWQAQNLSDELTVLLAQSCDEADFSSVLAAIRATREEFLMEEVEELRSLAGGFQWKELIEELSRASRWFKHV